MSLRAKPFVQKDAENPASLAGFLLGLEIRRWDVIAFTDGSGSIRGKPGGYAAVYRTHDSLFQAVVGSSSSTTSQEAELRAVYELIVQLLAAKRNQKKGGLLVQLITDSSYVHQKLASLDPLATLDSGKHSMFWAGLIEATRRGVRVAPHYVPRNQNPLMTLADTLSKRARHAINSVEIEQLLSHTMNQCDQEFSISVQPHRKGKI